ncbi:DUF4869 domain-containing protein [Butyrivibrio sp. WCD2001]|nr:DUF4869 domain-containing protein [Butyrivibrio sp. WCD2001]
MDDAIYHPPAYFDNTYEDDWITNDLSVRIQQSPVLVSNGLIAILL